MLYIQPFHRLARIFAKSKGLARSVLWIAAYAFWISTLRLITLTLITFFTASSTSRLQDITDAVSSNEVSLMGLSAVLFIGLLHAFSPALHPSLAQLLGRDRIEKSFLFDFAQGCLFASSLVVLFILLGSYDYLGYYIRFEEAPLEIVNVLMRVLALLGLAYFEAYFFHDLVRKEVDEVLPPWLAAVWISLLYCGIKRVQFDLGHMQLLSLFWVSMVLYDRTHLRKTQGRDTKIPFARGAAFWAALLIIFHPLLSLPTFGNDFSGILWVKPHLDPWISKVPVLLEKWISKDTFSWNRLLTGGAGGPLSGIVFQVFLILDMARRATLNRFWSNGRNFHKTSSILL